MADMHTRAPTEANQLATATAGEYPRVLALVADCGSGSTRVVQLSQSLEGEVDCNLLPGRVAPLATALSLSGDGGDAVLDMIEQNLRRAKSVAMDVAVIIGATAGVRAAVAAGDVDSSAIEAFCKKARARFAAQLLYVGVLSPEMEAVAEYVSTKHALARAGGLPRGLTMAGIISGGGMSGQLVLTTGKDGAPEAFSYRNLVLEPGSLCARARSGEVSCEGLITELIDYGDALEKAFDCGGLPKMMSGAFVAIEWFGSFIARDQAEATAQEAGKRVLSLGWNCLLERNAVVAAADDLLDELRTIAMLTPKKPSSKQLATAICLCVLTKSVLLRCFEPNAVLYCMRGLSWTHGHYLNILHSG